MLPEDYIHPYLGLFSRIKIVMAVVLFILAAVLVNLKVHAGFEITRTMIEIVVGAGFICAVIIAITWHKSTACEED